MAPTIELSRCTAHWRNWATRIRPKKESRASIPGLCEGGSRLRGPVVFAGHFEKFGFDRFPIACSSVAGKFAESFVAKFAFVPAFRPSESVVQPIQFRFTLARTRSIPAAFRSVFAGVIPIAAASRVQGQLDQAKAHLDVADDFGFVERAGEGPEFDSVVSAGEVRQVQKVVAIRFAFAFRVVFVPVLFDLLAVDVLFAAFGSGAGEDRSFVVSDQRNQAGQGGGVAVPFDRYVYAASLVGDWSKKMERSPSLTSQAD